MSSTIGSIFGRGAICAASGNLSPAGAAAANHFRGLAPGPGPIGSGRRQAGRLSTRPCARGARRAGPAQTRGLRRPIAPGPSRAAPGRALPACSRQAPQRGAASLQPPGAGAARGPDGRCGHFRRHRLAGRPEHMRAACGGEAGTFFQPLRPDHPQGRPRHPRDAAAGRGGADRQAARQALRRRRDGTASPAFRNAGTPACAGKGRPAGSEGPGAPWPGGRAGTGSPARPTAAARGAWRSSATPAGAAMRRARRRPPPPPARSCTGTAPAGAARARRAGRMSAAYARHGNPGNAARENPRKSAAGQRAG